MCHGRLVRPCVTRRNALAGKPIPRKAGVTGSSAYVRLQRVFGEVTELVHSESIGELDIKGLRRPITVFNVLDLKEGTAER